MSEKWITFFKRLGHKRGSKLVALLLALVTWYAIQPSISHETILSDIPLRISVDTGWAVLEQSVGSVDVHFRGSREAIRFMSLDDIEVLVDVRGQDYSDSFTVPVDVKNVRTTMGGVRPTFIRPSEVTLSVDKEEDRLVPVRVHIQGEPPPGYEIESMMAIPAAVVVSGPRQRLDAIEAIRTTPIDMEGRLQSFKLRVGLVSPSRTWVARMDPDRVEVDIMLLEQSAAITFTNIPINLLGRPAHVLTAIVPDTHTVTVEVVGRSELLDTLRRDSIRAYVDLNAVPVDGLPRTSLPVRVHLPPGIRLERVDPAEILLQERPAL
jgi:YbbR domain-containing protein